jgi:hypothetical protein
MRMDKGDLTSPLSNSVYVSLGHVAISAVPAQLGLKALALGWSHLA